MAKSAAKISIAIEAQTASLQKGFAEAKGAINSLESSMSMSVAKGMAMFTAGLGAVKAALAMVQNGLNAVAASMAELGRQQSIAAKVGMTADSFAALSLAAQHAGGDTNKLADILKDMSERISEAAVMGTGEAVEALEELGLSAQRLNQMSGEQKLGALADALAGIGNEGDRTRLTIRLFADAGYELVHMLSMGSAGLDQAAEEAKRLGLTLGEQRQLVTDANKAVTDMKAAWGSFVNMLAVTVAPMITWISNAITQMAVAIRKLFGWTGAEITKFSGGLEKAKLKADDVTADMLKEQERLAAEAERASEAIASRGEAITKSLREPAEIFADTMMELNDLVQAGAISWTVYQRGIRKAVEEIQKGRDAADWQTPSIGAAIIRGSSAAFSAHQADQRAREDAERKHREQVGWLARIERAVKEHSIELQPVSL